MKAFRNISGNIVEIQVDVDPEGTPLLPPDTTVDAKPEPLDGHYVTIVDKSWVQIPNPVQVYTLENKRPGALDKLSAYKNWYLEQPVALNGQNFDADEQARNRLTQALVINGATGYLPPVWIDADNQPYPIATLADLAAIIQVVSETFAARFYETSTVRSAILAATTLEELDAIIIPEIPQDTLI